VEGAQLVSAPICRGVVFEMTSLVRLSLLPLLIGALLLGFACQGGDEDERVAAIIRGLLLAGRQDDSGDLETFVGELPEALPEEPPLYPDARIIVSSQQPGPLPAVQPDAGEEADASQGMLFFIVLDSSDPRADVAAYYEEALDEEPWQIEESVSTEEQDAYRFSSVDDADIGGAVAITRGEEDDHTGIYISLQDAGATVEEQPFEPGESLAVPKAFPEDVPLYGGSTLTSTAFFRAPGNESFLIIFLTRDSQDEVLQFYRDELEARGWTVEDATGPGLAGRLEFRDDAGDIQGVITADRFERDRDYTKVQVEVQTNPAREPAGDEETPEPSDTPEEDGADTPDETATPKDGTPSPTGSP